MVQVSEVYIGNQALLVLGVSSFIQSVDEASKEARSIKTAFDSARREALAAANWAFARKRQALAVHSEEAPTDDWTFRYQYPVDCLVARKLENPFGWQGDAIPFVVETNSTGTELTILTDMESAKLIYTFDQMNYNLYPDYFITTLSYLLAAKIALPVTGKAQNVERAYQLYNGALQVAPAINANAEVQRGPRDAAFVRAHGINPNKGNIFSESQ